MRITSRKAIRLTLMFMLVAGVTVTQEPLSETANLAPFPPSARTDSEQFTLAPKQMATYSVNIAASGTSPDDEVYNFHSSSYSVTPPENINTIWVWTVSGGGQNYVCQVANTHWLETETTVQIDCAWRREVEGSGNGDGGEGYDEITGWALGVANADEADLVAGSTLEIEGAPDYLCIDEVVDLSSWLVIGSFPYQDSQLVDANWTVEPVDPDGGAGIILDPTYASMITFVPTETGKVRVTASVPEGSGTLTASVEFTIVRVLIEPATDPGDLISVGSTREYTASVTPAAAAAAGDFEWYVNNPNKLDFVGGNNTQTIMVTGKVTSASLDAEELTVEFSVNNELICTTSTNLTVVKVEITLDEELPNADNHLPMGALRNYRAEVEPAELEPAGAYEWSLSDLDKVDFSDGLNDNIVARLVGREISDAINAEELSLTFSVNGGEIIQATNMTVVHTGFDPTSHAEEDLSVDPISMSSTANIFSETDIFIPTPGLPLLLRRTYNSRWDEYTRTGNADQKMTVAPFGLNWTHSLDWFLDERGYSVYRETTGESWQVLHTGDSALHWFREIAPGTYAKTIDDGYALSGNVVTLRGGLSATFDADGLVQTIQDADGNTLTFQYTFGPAGGTNLCDKVLASVTHNAGQSLDFEYQAFTGDDRVMNLISMINTSDPGFYVEYSYNANGQLNGVIQHTADGDYGSSYGYGTADALVTRTTRSGHVAGFSYNTEHNRVGQVFARTVGMSGMDGYWAHSVTYDDGASVLLDPPPETGTTVVNYPGTPGQVVEYSFDPRKRRVEATAVGGSTRTLNYSGDNRREIVSEVVTETATARIDRTFDQNQRPTSVAFGYDGVGSAWNFGWGANDTLTSVTDPDSVQTTFAYNGLKLTGINHADGSSVSISYANGLPSAVNPSWGPEVSYSRDDWHHVTQITASGRSVGMEVDRLGRVLSVSYPDGGSENFTYGARSVPLTHTGRGGRTTQFSYNPGNRLTQVSRGGLDLLTIDYEQQMQAVAIRDALDRSVESYVIDSQYRPLTVSNVFGQSMSVSYTVGGYADSITRFDGTQLSMNYNNNGFPTSVAYPDQTYSFGYTSAGRLTSAANALGSVGISYNAAGQPASVGGLGPAPSTTYSYTGGGLPAGYTNVAGTWANSYSGWQIESISGPHGGFEFDHDQYDQIESVDFPGGVVLDLQHDLIGRLTGMRWTDSGNTTLKEFTYAYDAYDRISSITNEAGGWIDYTYDDNLDWLLSKTVRDTNGTPVRSYAYTFDNVGNRLSDSANGVTNTYSLSGGDRLTGVSYSTAGCVTGIRDLTLDWNGGYQLVEAARGGVTNSYQYDALGRLSSISDGQQTNWLVYGGAHVSAETDASGNVLRSYTHGPGIDWIMSMQVHQGSQTNVYIYLTDHVGTVHALVDAATSNIVESYTYDAFGVVSAFDGAGNPITVSQVGNSHLFHGRRYDWDTGLYHFRARWYDPVTGRWLSNDPIGINGGLNQYVAFGNNPVMFVDPFGLCSEDYRDGDQILQNIRDFFDAGQQVTDSSWWAGDWYIEFATMLALHSGPWSPLDFHAQADGRDFIVNGFPMTSGEFGNYTAGYSAGYADTPGLYTGVRIGGIGYATLFRTEHWTDRDSVPAINQGFEAGRAARGQ